jgi:anaerobic magnesium-protoporphyrin IX monomethyl ester cyclase
VDVIGRWIPLNFVYLAGSARLAGLDAEIYDARAKEHDYPEIEQKIRQSCASYIATTALTSSINDALKTLKLAKSINPQIVTILGGIHPTLCYEEILNPASAVDYIVCGEGEVTLRELLLCLESGGSPDDVPGLAFLRDGDIVKTSKRIVAGSLDDLPTAWDLLDWQEYKYFVIPNSRLGAISTSRTQDHRRFRDPLNVTDEIAHLHETYGVNVFLVTDQCPTIDQKHWETVLDLMLERDLPVYLLMQTSAADIIRDRNIIWKYRKAGIVHVYLSIETIGHDSIKEGSGVAGGKLALDILREHGIVSEASFVVGGPDETKSSVESTFRLAQYCNPDNVQFLPLTPWPKDAAYDDVRQYIKVHDYSKYNLIDPVIEPRNMSLLQVDSAIMNCHRRFYMGKLLEVITMKDAFKRDYLMQAMKLMMFDPFILRKLGISTLGTIPAKIGEMMRKT